MISFIITFAFFFLIFGGFVYMIVDSNTGGGIKSIITTVLIGGVLSFIFTFGLWAEKTVKEEAWSGGNCPYCNTKWELVNVDKNRHGDKTYYYTCPDCGTIIEQ